jgi:hypothetical protein
VRPNRYRYLTSLADELIAQAHRVRDLIGDAHWLSDGHHKEYLFIDLLKRHLPSGMIASRGFVISPVEPNSVSTEQDVLIVDTLGEAPVFSQSGMVIAFPRSVKAVVSVKTTLDPKNVIDAVEGLRTVRDISAGRTDPRSLWCGAYYFTENAAARRDPMIVFEYIQKAITAAPAKAPLIPASHPHPVGPDLHSSSRELVFKLDHGYQDEGSVTSPRLMGYRCGGLATALFLGELLDHVGSERGLTDTDFSLWAEAEVVKLLAEPQPLA